MIVRIEDNVAYRVYWSYTKGTGAKTASCCIEDLATKETVNGPAVTYSDSPAKGRPKYVANPHYLKQLGRQILPSRVRARREALRSALAEANLPHDYHVYFWENYFMVTKDGREITLRRANKAASHMTGY